MMITPGQRTLKNIINVPLRLLRLLPAALLMAALTILPACMAAPHHTHEAEPKTNQNTEPHVEHNATMTEPAGTDIATEETGRHAQQAMSMMHGSGPWGWLVGGTMAVVMVVVMAL